MCIFNLFLCEYEFNKSSIILHAMPILILIKIQKLTRPLWSRTNNLIVKNIDVIFAWSNFGINTIVCKNKDLIYFIVFCGSYTALSKR